MVVNGNLGTGVAVAGAFSLVRFRSMPGTSREIASIFISMGMGLANGMGYVGISCILLLMVCIITLIISYIQSKAVNDRELKITIAENMDYDTAFDEVKVVILGQDPYHGPNQAHGLAFSVKPEVAIPPSLLNMYKELANDIPGFQMPNHGYLVKWAEQGALLLNTVLTVERGMAHSHAKFGWEVFTDQVIAALNEHREKVVFLLWGSHAQKKGQFIDRNRHYVLTAPHPSPLSAHRGFLGCHHFSKTNEYLKQNGLSEIDWQV